MPVLCGDTLVDLLNAAPQIRHLLKRNSQTHQSQPTGRWIGFNGHPKPKAGPAVHNNALTQSNGKVGAS